MNPLLWGLALLTYRASSAPRVVELQAGKSYRYAGVLISRGSVDVADLAAKLGAVGARNVIIGERAPHRVRFTMTAQYEHRIELGRDLMFTPDGIRIRVESITPVAGGSVLVG